MATVSITATSVFKSTNAQFQGPLLAAAAITAGQVLYRLAAGTLGLADANGTSPANTVIGIALNGAAVGQPVLYVATDSAFTFGGTSTAGKTFYLSATAGGIVDDIADVTAGCTVISLGGTTSTTVMNLDPVVGGVVPA